jgi:hypothetical protein
MSCRSSGLLAVDVARQVQVEVVLLDLVNADHAGILGDSSRRLKTSTIRWMSCSRRRFLGPSFMKPCAGVDHEDALAGVGVLLVDDDDAGGDAGAVEQVGGQADDALDVALADQVAADVGLGVAPEQHAVRQDAGALAGALERADDVQQVGVVALLGGRVPKAWKRS